MESNGSLTKLVGKPQNISSGPYTSCKDKPKMGVGGKFLPSKGDAKGFGGSES
jgi:hypothetical protein